GHTGPRRSPSSPSARVACCPSPRQGQHTADATPARPTRLQRWVRGQATSRAQHGVPPAGCNSRVVAPKLFTPILLDFAWARSTPLRFPYPAHARRARDGTSRPWEAWVRRPSRVGTRSVQRVGRGQAVGGGLLPTQVRSLRPPAAEPVQVWSGRVG